MRAGYRIRGEREPGAHLGVKWREADHAPNFFTTELCIDRLNPQPKADGGYAFAIWRQLRKPCGFLERIREIFANVEMQ